MRSLPTSRLSEAVQRELEVIVGSRWLSTKTSERLESAARLKLVDRSRRLYPGPDAVVWPGSAVEIGRLLEASERLDFVLLPWRWPEMGRRLTQPAVHLDLKRFHRIVEVSERSRFVEVETGMAWQRFEEELRRRGYSTGLVTDAEANVGDWLFCGQDAPPGLEDAVELLLGMTVVLPDGSTCKTPICVEGSRGLDWLRNSAVSPTPAGIPIRVALKIHPCPETRHFASWGYESVALGLSALRQSAQRGFSAEILLLDELEGMLLQYAHEEGFLARMLQRILKNLPGILPNLFKRGREVFNRGRAALFGKGEMLGLKLLLQQPGIFGAFVRQLKGTSTLIAIFGGGSEAVAVQERALAVVCREQGGRDLGTGPAKGWWQQRPILPNRQARFGNEGCFVGSFQVTSTWDRCLDVYEAVKRSLESRALVLTRFHKATPQGCQMEFTFIAVGDEGDATFPRWIVEAVDGALREGGSLGRRSGLGSDSLRPLSAQFGPLLKLPMQPGETSQAEDRAQAAAKEGEATP